jgi:dTDP-glucose 4,6-dehydratase
VEVKVVSDMILKYLGMDDNKVTYLPEDKHNIVNKRPDISKAKKDLGHECRVKLKEGIPKTIDWMKSVYLTKK